MSHPFAVVAWNHAMLADVVGPFDNKREAQATAERMRNEDAFAGCQVLTVEMRPTR